jgi:hypothetical protein
MGLTKYHKRKPKPITNFNCIIHLKKALWKQS